MPSSHESTNWIRGQRNFGKIAQKILKGSDDKTCEKWHLMGNCFWAAVYLAGTVLLVLTCNDLYQQYKTEFASINIAVVQNKTFTIPDPTICVPCFHADELIDAHYKLYSKRNMLDDDSEGDNGKSDFYVNELQKYFNNFASWQEAREHDWPLSLLRVAQIYLGIIYETELLNGNDKHPMEYINDLDDNMTQSITDVLIPKMDGWNVTLTEFRDAFAYHFGRFYRITASMYSYQLGEFIDLEDMDKHETPIGNRNRELVFVNRYQVCYKLKLNEVIFNGSSSIRIEIDRYNQTFDLKYFKNSFYDDLQEGDYFSEPVAIDMSGKRRAGLIPHPADSIYLAKFCNYLRLTVTPSYHYTLLAEIKGNQQCSLYETMEECRAKCRRNSIAKLCNCTAASLDWLPDSDDSTYSGTNTSCQFGQYEICLRNFAGNEDSDCMNKCLDICTPSTFSIAKTSYSESFQPLNFNENLSSIEIKIAAIEYLEITEYSDWTFARITGVIGGALSFWLGIDIFTIVYITLITLILSIKDQFYLNFFKKNSTNIEVIDDSNQNSKTEKLWQWFIKIFDQNARLLNFSKNDRINWLLKKIVWLSLFLPAVALTVNNLVPLVNNYIKNDTTFSLNVQFNTSIRIPNIAVCNPIDAIQAVSHRLYNYHVEADELYDRSKFDNYFNQRHMSKNKFLSNEKSWPRLAMITVLMYLQAVHQITISTYDHYMLKYWQDSSEYSSFVPWIEFRSFLVKWSITDTELLQKFTIEYIKQHAVEAECIPAFEHDGNVTITPTISFETTLIILTPWSPTTVCLHFPLSQFEFKSNSDKCSIRMSKSVNEYDSNRYITIKTPDSYNDFNDLPLDFNLNKMDFTFDYSTIYQKLETAACSKDNLPLIDCMDNCRMELIDDHCAKCTIISSDRIENAGEPWKEGCEWKEYEACLKLTAEPFKNCSGKCQENPPCTRIEYTFKKASDIAIANWYEYERTFVNIYVKDFTYSLMSERHIWTAEGFIAACGGVLGFWIGLDATFIIQIFFTPLMFCIGLCIKKKDNATSINNRHFVLDYIAKVVGIAYKRMPRLMIVKALIEKQFWIAVYALFAILTANHCLHYIKKCNSALGFHFELMRNETVTLPDITICVPVTPDMTLFGVMEDSENLSAVNQMFEKINATKSTLLDSNRPWPVRIIRNALFYMTLVEGYKTLDWSSTWEKNVYYYPNDMKAFREKMDELQITHEELTRKIDQESQRMLRKEVAKYVSVNGSLVDQEIIMKQITFISYEKICYTLPNGAMSFSSPLEYIKIKIYWEWSADSIRTSHCRNTTINTSIGGIFTTIDLFGSDSGDDSDDSVLKMDMGDSKITSISMARAVRILPVFEGKKRCTTDTSRTVCADRCRVDSVKPQCGCEPSECRFAQLNECVPNFNRTDLIKCIDRCLPVCERTNYKFDTNDAVDATDNSDYPCIAEYKIGISNFQYPLFSEKLDTSFFDIIATLGGLMCIWLPLDVIFFIEGFILLGKRLFCKKKQQQKIAQRNQEDTILEDKRERIKDLNIQTEEID